MSDVGILEDLPKYLSSGPKDVIEEAVADLLTILFSSSELRHHQAAMGAVNQLLTVLRLGSRGARYSAARALQALDLALSHEILLDWEGLNANDCFPNYVRYLHLRESKVIKIVIKQNEAEGEAAKQFLEDGPADLSTESIHKALDLEKVPIIPHPKAIGPAPVPANAPATIKHRKGLCAKHTCSCVNGVVLRQSYPRFKFGRNVNVLPNRGINGGKVTQQQVLQNLNTLKGWSFHVPPFLIQ
eukprot:Gb_34678 [translate_table: standard]